MGWGDMISGAVGGTIGLGTGLAGSLFGGGGTPPPPDIAAQNAANIAAARETAKLNNPNIINQYGTTTFTEGADGRPTMTQSLSPEEQALFQSQQANRRSTADLAGKGLTNLGDTFGTKFDISGAPTAPQDSESIRKSVIDAMMSRNDPRLKQAAEQQDSDLVAAGIRPGTEAWARAKTEQGQNRNDMLNQAQLAAGQESSRAFDQDTQSRKNYISELLQQRQQPLNEINSLMSGSQQNNPFANQGYQGGAAVQSTAGVMDKYNMDVYNQKQSQQNALIGGAAQLGGAFLLSDSRLKTDIERIGTHKLGIGLYSWKYLGTPPSDFDMKFSKLANWGGKSIGVMADELKKVMPEAVIRAGNYDAVDYGMIGD